MFSVILAVFLIYHATLKEAAKYAHSLDFYIKTFAWAAHQLQTAFNASVMELVVLVVIQAIIAMETAVSLVPVTVLRVHLHIFVRFLLQDIIYELMDFSIQERSQLALNIASHAK
jgi:hypothetical protein